MPQRSNDDFFVRPQRGNGGGRGRRGGPPEMYHRGMGYNFGPQRGYDDHYEEQQHYYNYGGPMYPPRGGYNARGHYPREGGMPPGGGPRFRPEFDGRQGQPDMRGRGPPMRGRRDDHPGDDSDHRGGRGRGGRGRGGRDDGPLGDRPQGGPPMRGGPRPMRGRGG